MDLTYLVLGASGMLGSACMRALGDNGDAVWGTVRNASSLRAFPLDLQRRVIAGVDAENIDAVAEAMQRVRPDVVVNCIGMVKQLEAAQDPLVALPLNSLFPHRLYRLCQLAGVRLVHVSTDCVFTGDKGAYVETDTPDAHDLYGISKYLGEVAGPGAITLRTSIIGHELSSSRSLIDWFLGQEGKVEGYASAIYSGLPTVEIARIIRDIIPQQPNLSGLFHVSSEPINKFELLKLVAAEYAKQIDIEPTNRVVIDRSLVSTRFRSITGYEPPPWPELVRRMRAFG